MSMCEYMHFFMQIYTRTYTSESMLTCCSLVLVYNQRNNLRVTFSVLSLYHEDKPVDSNECGLRVSEKAGGLHWCSSMMLT